MTTSPTRTWNSIAIACVALLALGPLAATAGDADHPEIADPNGDVNPAVAYAQLPKDLALANHAEMYDLNKTYVALEELGAFYIRIQVADLMDNLSIPAGAVVYDNAGRTMNPSPIPLVAGNPIPWDPSWFNNKINLTAFFTIKGHEYRAVASLAEVNLQTARTDVGAGEEVVNLPEVSGCGEPVVTNCVTVTPSLSTGATQQVPVNTAEPEHSAKAILFERYALFDDAGHSFAIDGVSDLHNDWVQMRIPKDKVGAPLRGEVLSHFRAESALKTTIRMDFAPDAVTPSVNGACPVTQSLSTDSVMSGAGQLVCPAFGADYRFVYPLPNTSGGGGTTSSSSRAANSNGPAGRLDLEPQAPTLQRIHPGQSATFVFTVRNTGTAALSGLFSLSSPAAGWAHQLDASAWSLAAGKSMVVKLTVTGTSGGASDQISRVTVSPAGGENQFLEFRTSFTDAGQGPAGGENVQAKGKKSPGMEVSALLVSLALLVVLVRRRQ